MPFARTDDRVRLYYEEHGRRGTPTDQLSRLRMPVLLLGGDRDPSLGPMKVMHRKVRGSKLVVLSPASHFGNRNQAEVWNRAVLDFLARCDRRTRG